MRLIDRNMPKSLKRKCVEEPASDIPEVLLGEVARLDARFKVSWRVVRRGALFDIGYDERFTNFSML